MVGAPLTRGSDLHTSTPPVTTDEVPQAAPPRGPGRGRPFLLGAAVALVAVVVAALVGPWWRDDAEPASDGVDPAVSAAIAAAVEEAAGDELSVADVRDAVAPAMVLVQVERPATAGDDSAGGLGSGVVVNADGTVLTALHVVEGATAIRLTFADGTTSAATVAASEADRDIAQLTPSTLPEIVVPAVLGSAGALRIGDVAVAVGHPLGLVGTTTAGVISGLDRSMPVGDSDRRIEGLIQFDAAVNPGSSGGPLLNARGEVVGIVTALVNPSGERAFLGIGFAIPIGAALTAGGGEGPAK